MKVKLKTRNVKENIIKNKTTTKDIDFHEKKKNQNQAIHYEKILIRPFTKKMMTKPIFKKNPQQENV